MCPICPKCKKIISYLREVRTGVEKCEVFFNEDKERGFIDWRDEEFEGDGIVLEYHCPECDEELDFDEQEAQDFLINKDEVAEMVAKKIEMNNKKFSSGKINQNKNE